MFLVGSFTGASDTRDGVAPEFEFVAGLADDAAAEMSKSRRSSRDWDDGDTAFAATGGGTTT